MRHKLFLAGMTLAVVAAIAAFLVNFFGVMPSAEVSDAELAGISLPSGFSISVFADNLGGSAVSSPGPSGGPRMMEYYNGVLLASLMGQGKVIALPDSDGNGKADKVVVVADGLDRPHGLAVYGGELFIAEESRVIRGSLDNNFSLVNISVVVDGLPSGGGHFTRTIVIRNGTIYLSIGSSCNACIEDDVRRASILECSMAGQCRVFASGLRNSVGLAVHPVSGELWATDNGRDFMGNDLPPDEVNILREGKNYGWPFCYGNKVPDGNADCSGTESPVAQLQAHSAPLGLAFYDIRMFPEDYLGSLFVAYHGSWNRQPPTGYKIVRLKLDGNSVVAVEDFASGWLDSATVIGRPVGVIVASDGALLVSDDHSGRIYRISYG